MAYTSRLRKIFTISILALTCCTPQFSMVAQSSDDLDIRAGSTETQKKRSVLIHINVNNYNDKIDDLRREISLNSIISLSFTGSIPRRFVDDIPDNHNFIRIQIRDALVDQALGDTLEAINYNKLSLNVKKIYLESALGLAMKKAESVHISGNINSKQIFNNIPPEIAELEIVDIRDTDIETGTRVLPIIKSISVRDDAVKSVNITLDSKSLISLAIEGKSISEFKADWTNLAELKRITFTEIDARAISSPGLFLGASVKYLYIHDVFIESIDGIITDLKGEFNHLRVYTNSDFIISDAWTIIPNSSKITVKSKGKVSISDSVCEKRPNWNIFVLYTDC